MTQPALLSADTKQLLEELADVLPAQGTWTEADYLWLTNHTNHLIELADGRLEILPMPTETHQRIVLALYRLLYAFIAAQHLGGILMVAPLRLRLGPRRYREPDLLYLPSPTDPRRNNEYWGGADLVIEVVSPSNAELDLVTKRQEYAHLGIPEYWLVNPQTATITVLHLAAGGYVEHGTFGVGAHVTSVLFSGLRLSVEDVFTPEA